MSLKFRGKESKTGFEIPPATHNISQHFLTPPSTAQHLLTAPNTSVNPADLDFGHSLQKIPKDS